MDEMKMNFIYNNGVFKYTIYSLSIFTVYNREI